MALAAYSLAATAVVCAVIVVVYLWLFQWPFTFLLPGRRAIMLAKLRHDTFHPLSGRSQSAELFAFIVALLAAVVLYYALWRFNGTPQ